MYASVIKVGCLKEILQLCSAVGGAIEEDKRK